MGLATNSFALALIGGSACPQADDSGPANALGTTRSTGQSRTGSLIESITNIAAGIGVAFISQEIIFNRYGISVTMLTNIKIVAWFTVISLVRQFLLRRIFNWLTTNGHEFTRISRFNRNQN